MGHQAEQARARRHDGPPGVVVGQVARLAHDRSAHVVEEVDQRLLLAHELERCAVVAVGYGGILVAHPVVCYNRRMPPTVFGSPKELFGAAGQELGTSDWVEITQEQINQFADATGDHQWIHVDVERAKQGPFGTPIAHGYLTMSLASMFLPQIAVVHGITMGLNYGVDRVRFPAPVPVGSRVRGRGQLLSASEVPGGVQVVTRVTIELEGSEKPAAVVDTVSRYLT
jgi:acyl dehydratase